MRISEAWLRESVDPPISTQQMVDQLTMAGLEVDSVVPAAAAFKGVVVGEVTDLEIHPDADRLKICKVSTDSGEPLKIVCGANNVYVGMRVPTALVGAVLPGNFRIKKSKLRGELSFGMLCSEQELGLEDSSDGLMELPADAPVGCDIREYMQLDDSIIDIDLTPNRADCLSVEGIAREIALLNKIDWSASAFSAVNPVHENTQAINIDQVAACPRYLGRLISHVNPAAQTPLWMQERLRRSGLRSLGPLIDVTNYLLLEIGQPLHAFDADKIDGCIRVRLAQAGEKLMLLNDQEVTLDPDILVIADDNKPLALAGIMGGKDSAVNDATDSIFLECAFFSPNAIVGKARRLGLHTDSSHRFERGVDPKIQRRAIERASELIVSIAGGKPGPIVEVTHESELPKRNTITLRSERIGRTLGVELTTDEVQDILCRLGMSVENTGKYWHVVPPSSRFDIEIEADLIEELGRVYGYDALPRTSLLMRSELAKTSEKQLDIDRAKDLLVARAYQEAITYSFVDQTLQSKITPDKQAIPLKNPLSSELSVMRTSLWTGLLLAAQRNIKRQQMRVRLFESGLKFVQEDVIYQEKFIAGLSTGSVVDEQWGAEDRHVDFFDMKSDIEALLSLTRRQFQFVAGKHPALHPGQTAEILASDNQNVGWLGMLHPNLESELGFDSRVFVFELNENKIFNRKIPEFHHLSKFPSVRRDIAVIVKESVSAFNLVNCLCGMENSVIKNVRIFDVYRGQGVELGFKSVALGLILQASSQTLKDSDIDAIVKLSLEKLDSEFGATLRE